MLGHGAAAAPPISCLEAVFAGDLSSVLAARQPNEGGVRRRLRLLGLAALAAVTATCAITAATASAAPARGSISAPITAAQSGGTLSGVYTITSFATNAAGQLVANGTFTGTFTDASGAVQQILSVVLCVVTHQAAA